MKTLKKGGWHPYPPADDGLHHTVSGTVLVLPELESPRLGNARSIYVYLPPSYSIDEERRFPVLYMHDGQNLFDQATSFGDEWQVDESMEEVAGSGIEAIVVGIPNRGGERSDEYSPFVDRKHGGGRGGRYLDFLTRTLKPRIDREFRTLPDRESTGVAGSSLGGLISLYAFFEAPDIFGFAGVLSPALWFAHREIFRTVSAADYHPGRIYLDVGTKEGWGTVRNARRMRDLLHRKGYDAEWELVYVEERGAGHTEEHWARRFRQALPFLLVGRSPAPESPLHRRRA